MTQSYKKCLAQPSLRPTFLRPYQAGKGHKRNKRGKIFSISDKNINFAYQSELMTKHLLTILMAVCLVACGTGRTMEQRRADEARMLERLADSLSRGSLCVEIDYMMPQRMQPRHLTTLYQVEVRRDTLVSSLPYWGVAHQADRYGSTEGPLSFEGRILNYEVSRPRADRLRLVVATRNEANHDLLVYAFDFFGNGRTMLSVRSDHRDAIEFTGNVKVTP